MLTAHEIAAAADYPALLATARRPATPTRARSSPALITWLRPKASGSTDITGLMALRERLIADLREARRRHHSTCRLADRLQLVIIDILRRRA